jgi:hypothetical protein
MTYSQASQDDFVDLALNSQATGYFVDVGAGCDDPRKESNSLLFEERGWNGIAIDMDPFRLLGRNCKCYSCKIGDGTNGTETLGQILISNDCPKVVDYLSIDLEGMDLIAVKSFTESGFRFKVATIEHNLYSGNPGVADLKRNICSFLEANGYCKVVDNAGHMAKIGDLRRGYAFEDWYIDPSVVNHATTVEKLGGKR